MDFNVRKRKSWEDEGGVSEVIGNILILMMTVVLFSGIIAFVQQMPVPEQTTKADFSASISFSGNYRHANLTLVHAGGKVLDVKIVKIIINKDGVNFAYNLTDDPNFLGTTWNTGRSWTMQIDGTTSGSTIIATVVDLDKSNAIWTSQVTGGLKGNPPNILQRYIDSNPDTATPDAVKENDTFTLFVKVEDPDGDLDANNVWIDARGVNIDGSNGAHRKGTYRDDGWFTWAFGKVWNASAIDKSVVVIHANDTAGHEAVSSYIIDVTMLPSDVIIQQMPTYSELGASGLPAWLSYISSGLGHGFGIYREAVANGTARGKADTDQPATDFVKDHNVFIRFASLTMSNLFVKNQLIITDTRTGSTFAPDYDDAHANSTVSVPFTPYPTGGSAYVYECVFNTSNLPPSAYTITMLLKNQPGTGQSQQNFEADQMITVTQLNSPDLFIPEVQLFKGGWDTSWGVLKNEPFDISSSDANTLYVAIKVQDTQVTSPSVSEIRIKDMSGGSQVFGVPPAGSMMSKIRTLDSVRYNFSIALRLYNGDQWLPGTNAYTIYVSRLSDVNEGVYSLSKQFWVMGAGGKADFFAGSAGLASGNSNFNTREYVHYVQNNNFFTSRIMWQSESTPGSSSDFTVTAMGAGDIDGDGDKDLLVGLATWNKLLLFENTLNLFGTWQAGSAIHRNDSETYPITWIAFGDINGDGHDDFAYSNSNSQIVLYNSTYGSRGWIYNPIGKWTGAIAKIALEDMTGDGLADLVVLANGRLWIYDIKYSYSPLLDHSKALFANTTTTGTKDFDIEDMNGDGMLDILTTGTTGAFNTTAGVNVNYFQTGAGTPTPLNTSYFDPIYGAPHGNSVSDATTPDNNQGLILKEEIAGKPNAGSLSAVLRFTKLSSSPDQILHIRAQVSPGNFSSGEVIYVQVSSDGIYYTMVGQLDSTSWKYYDFKLPPVIAGTEMFLKITDSLWTADSASVQDIVELDYVVVLTDLFKQYEQDLVDGATNWKAVRAADIDRTGTGKASREVVMATNGATAGLLNMKVFRNSGTTWVSMDGTSPAGATSFYVETSARVDGAKYPYSSLAPTLFDVLDLNGDGFSDILTCFFETTGSGSSAVSTSKIGFYMNTYSGTSQSWRYFEVQIWNIIGNQGGTLPGPFVCNVVAANLLVS